MKTVLVVDDSAELCSLARTALEKNGYAVDTVQEIAPAVALLEAGLRPSLVVLDCILPVADGFEFLRRAKELAPELQVILVSGTLDLSTLKPQVAVRGKLQKPFTPDQLVTAVREVIGGPRGAAV